MSYPYSHTTRSDGTILTESVYNTDHQNHVNNQIPTSLDDYEVSVAQMQIVADPAPSGTPSRATSLAGEIVRLRYALKDVKRILGGSAFAPQWYAKLATLPMIANSARYELHTAAAIARNAIVPFDTVIYNTASMIDTTHHAVVAPADGIYRVGAMVFFGSPTISTAMPETLILQLKLSTGVVIAAQQDQGSALRYINKAVEVETVIRLTAGQYVQATIDYLANQTNIIYVAGPGFLPAYSPALWMSRVA